MKKIRVRNGVAVFVIFLFMGVAVAPSINHNVVIASQEDDLVEVTSQACGIKGYRDTTVKLTREQYQNLEQYLVEFRAKLNQITTREEAVPIFTEAIVKLDKYGLLPKGMSVEEVKKLVVNGYSKGQEFSIFEESSHKNSLQEYHNNFCCLVAGVVQEGSSMGVLSIIGIILMLLSIFPSPFPFLFGNDFILVLGGIFLVIGHIIATFSPFSVMQQIVINSGNLTFVGLRGVTQFNEGLLNGFTGIKITRFKTKEMYLLGSSLMVSYQD